MAAFFLMKRVLVKCLLVKRARMKMCSGGLSSKAPPEVGPIWRAEVAVPLRGTTRIFGLCAGVGRTRPLAAARLRSSHRLPPTPPAQSPKTRRAQRPPNRTHSRRLMFELFEGFYLSRSEELCIYASRLREPLTQAAMVSRCGRDGAGRALEGAATNRPTARPAPSRPRRRFRTQMAAQA